MITEDKLKSIQEVAAKLILSQIEEEVREEKMKKMKKPVKVVPRRLITKTTSVAIGNEDENVLRKEAGGDGKEKHIRKDETKTGQAVKIEQTDANESESATKNGKKNEEMLVKANETKPTKNDNAANSNKDEIIENNDLTQKPISSKVENQEARLDNLGKNKPGVRSVARGIGVKTTVSDVPPVGRTGRSGKEVGRKDFRTRISGSPTTRTNQQSDKKEDTGSTNRVLSVLSIMDLVYTVDEALKNDKYSLKTKGLVKKLTDDLNKSYLDKDDAFREKEPLIQKRPQGKPTKGPINREEELESSYVQGWLEVCGMREYNFKTKTWDEVVSQRSIFVPQVDPISDIVEHEARARTPKEGKYTIDTAGRIHSPLGELSRSNIRLHYGKSAIEKYSPIEKEERLAKHEKFDKLLLPCDNRQKPALTTSALCLLFDNENPHCSEVKQSKSSKRHSSKKAKKKDKKNKTKSKKKMKYTVKKISQNNDADLASQFIFAPQNSTSSIRVVKEKEPVTCIGMELKEENGNGDEEELYLSAISFEDLTKSNPLNQSISTENYIRICNTLSKCINHLGVIDEEDTATKERKNKPQKQTTKFTLANDNFQINECNEDKESKESEKKVEEKLTSTDCVKDNGTFNFSISNDKFSSWNPYAQAVVEVEVIEECVGEKSTSGCAGPCTKKLQVKRATVSLISRIGQSHSFLQPVVLYDKLAFGQVYTTIDNVNLPYSVGDNNDYFDEILPVNSNYWRNCKSEDTSKTPVLRKVNNQWHVYKKESKFQQKQSEFSKMCERGNFFERPAYLQYSFSKFYSFLETPKFQPYAYEPRLVQRTKSSKPRVTSIKDISCISSQNLLPKFYSRC